jgi:hypothetical protein
LCSRQDSKPLTVADLTPLEFKRVSLTFHEAGYAVAGVLHGGQLHSASVTQAKVLGTQGNTSWWAVSPV